MALNGCVPEDTKVLFEVLLWGERVQLRKTELPGACHSFGAPLDLEFAEDLPIVSFHRVQGEEEPLTNFVVGKSLTDEAENFQLALAQWLDQRLGAGPIRCVLNNLLPNSKRRQ